jgi:hypothetical protein
MESKGELGCGGKGASEGAKYEVPEWKPISKVENTRGSPGEMEQAIPLAWLSSVSIPMKNQDGVLDMTILCIQSNREGSCSCLLRDTLS